MVAVLEPNGKLKVRLNREEADFYRIHEIVLNYNEASVRESIVRLFVEASRKTGACYLAGNFLIEVFSMSDGGFLISFLPESDEKSKKCRRIDDGTALQSFSFENSEALLECIRALARSRELCKIKSSIYFCDKAYRLITQPTSRETELLIMEYAYEATKNSLDISYTVEHGSLVWKDNAISKLASIFL